MIELEVRIFNFKKKKSLGKLQKITKGVSMF